MLRERQEALPSPQGEGRASTFFGKKGCLLQKPVYLLLACFTALYLAGCAAMPTASPPEPTLRRMHALGPGYSRMA